MSSTPATLAIFILALSVTAYRSSLRPVYCFPSPARSSQSSSSSTTFDSTLKRPELQRAEIPKHALIAEAIDKKELIMAFESGVLKSYAEMKLPSYSRYEAWTQSCYMEIHPKWTPKPEINVELFNAMRGIQERCRALFGKWYAERYGLKKVEVTTLNSFVTKYVPSEGKNEFGKHVDGVKVHGSLVLALPTDEENDWEGILVWDGPKGRGPIGKDQRPEHHYVLNPGDALVLDRMVWHHGLPISKGNRYVVVNFYSVAWKMITMPGE